MDDILKRLQTPAIGLAIVGALNGTAGLLALVSGLMRLTGLLSEEKLPVNEAERMGFLIATVLIYGIALLSLITAPIIIYGAFQMMKAKSAGIVKFSTILAMLPFTACCFLAGIPIGAWSLYVITRPEVKLAFKGELTPINYNPPKPPTF